MATAKEEKLTRTVVKLLALYARELERRLEVLRRLDRIEELLRELDEPPRRRGLFRSR